jgi:peptidoglycan/xylan/chitin deacetylase (PgdA/CDA1 family)
MAPVLEPFYGGIGSIPVFHRVVTPRAGERLAFARQIETSVAELEGAIALLRRHGYTFVSLDELGCALGKARPRRSPKLAALTFDDGYRDNHDVAYPLLSSLGIPFAVFVATGFPDGTMIPWWYLLEERLLCSSRFALEHGGRTIAWRLDVPEAREEAFTGAAAIFTALSPSDVRSLAERTFGREQVERTIDSLVLTWDMIRAMDASGRVTIGAHTIDHVALPGLSLAEARAQVVGSRKRLEEQLGKSVRHFAYPFGAVGPRERDLVRSAGFSSAMTTCVANVFPEHANHRFTLPRVYAVALETAEPGDESIVRAELALQLRGASPALANRGRRVVTVGG